jgi:hypothetical protein
MLCGASGVGAADFSLRFSHGVLRPSCIGGSGDDTLFNVGLVELVVLLTHATGSTFCFQSIHFTLKQHRGGPAIPIQVLLTRHRVIG